MNKRGFIRTLEAVISVILLFGFMFYIDGNRELESAEVPFVVQNSHNFIFEEVGYNEEYRECVLERFSTGDCSRENDIQGYNWACMEDINEFISDSTPEGFNVACEVCKSSVSCLETILPVDRNIYANSLFISGANPKIMRIYFWEK